MTQKLETAVYVCWEESERGWGTRPDGCSLHLNSGDYDKFLKAYWARMPKETPNEYSRPTSSPLEVQVTPSLYKQIKIGKNGIRMFEHELNKIEKKNRIKFPDRRTGWVLMK